MTSYVPLLSVNVLHQFFETGMCSALDFDPNAETALFLKQYDLLIRKTSNGITVFCDSDALVELRGLAASGKELPMLAFNVFPQDQNFSQYTEPVASDRYSVLYFDGSQAVKQDDGRYCLHDSEFASAKFFQEVKSPAVQAAMRGQHALAKPFLIISVSPISATEAAAAESRQNNSPDSTPVDYYINFASRKSYWKYYIFGDLASRNLSIADLNNAVEFSNIGTSQIANNPALTFVSGSMIPMQHVPSQRFQLRENGAMGEKILIKRLPNASLNQISKEIVNQNAVLVSEMYIN